MFSTKEVRHNRITKEEDIMTNRNTNSNDWTLTVELGWKDIQRMLGKTAPFEPRGLRIRLRNRPLLERMLDYVPSLIWEEVSFSQQRWECTREEVIFMVDREGRLMKDSCPRRQEYNPSLEEEEGVVAYPHESVHDVLKRVSRRDVAAIVLARREPRSGQAWQTTVFHVQGGDLLHWYEERRKRIPNHAHRRRSSKAGRHWH